MADIAHAPAMNPAVARPAGGSRATKVVWTGLLRSSLMEKCAAESSESGAKITCSVPQRMAGLKSSPMMMDIDPIP